LVPLSGLLLVLFLVAHLGGAGLAVVDGAAFEAMASWLHRQGWLVAFELALAVVFLLHPVLALVRTVANRSARGGGSAPLRSRRGGGLEGLAALAARWIPWSGALLLLFLGVHLAQLRWQRPPAGAELVALRGALAAPPALVLYVLAGVALALHLAHGLEAAHRSLGWLDAANRDSIRWAGRLGAVLLGGGFSGVALAVGLGWFGVAP